ncbi:MULTISPECIES: beta-ketoacyl-ACP synthase III [Pseudomonas]|uniref:Beta-ketoacyl-ACP synthase III n=1 Tax=Pseudomonas aphyarum TaxID=2942629 RepID=A0ABT5PGQ6_9PSED|nr:beta-ketoacyl-ACP synthase III [Pseudomonas aphyarum]MDD0970174.1 beta-ketoacyl-ACP synthase III [Pseudomonas aphyarum]MDD1122993.1 beta-ketoacyl-ACP synthase III [Pseudomonas aphyarum]
MNNTVYINRTGTFLPGNPVSNEEIEGILGMVAGKPSKLRERILKSNGIKSRHYAIDPLTGRTTHTNAQLAAKAIQNALLNYSSLSDISLISCGTGSPDQILPSIASMVHGELKNPPCELASFSGACLSGLSAMKFGYMSILSGLENNAITTGSELTSTMMCGKNFVEELHSAFERFDSNPEIAFERDFLRWMLSDGAGAFLMTNKPNESELSLRIDWIEIFSYASVLPPCMYLGAEKLEDGSLKGWREFNSYRELGDRSIFSLTQDVKLLNEHVIDFTVARGLQDTLKKHPTNPQQIAWFLPHYSSNYFREKVYNSLKSIDFEIPFECWHTNLERVGNIGSASIYFLINDLLKSKKLKHGDAILCYVPESARFSTGFARMTAVQH